MKIGVLKEEKVPVDKRVPLTPKQCRVLLNTYPNLQIAVKSSGIRCFPDEMYISEGIQVVNDLSDCDVLIGVKEVPKSSLIPNKTYFYGNFYEYTDSVTSFTRNSFISINDDLTIDQSINIVDSISSIQGKQGIIYFENYHIDLFDGKGMIGNGQVTPNYSDNKIYFKELD